MMDSIFKYVRGIVGIEGDVQVVGSFLTNTELRATPVPISGSITVDTTGLATDTGQATSNTYLSAIKAQTDQFVFSGGRLEVILPPGGTGLTDAELRASDVDVNVTNTSFAVTGTFWQATQPISVATLPLPTGAATEVTLAALNTKIPSGLTVTSTRLLVDGSGVTQPVSGTFWQATQPVSATALPLPAGAATATKQDSQTTLLGSMESSLSDLVLTVGSDGSPPNTYVVQVAGFDGTNNQSLKTNSSGELQVGVVGTVPVSGAFYQATQPVSIAATVAVSGPLTDAQLRATAVPVSGTFYQATQPVSLAASVTVISGTATNLKAQAEMYQGGTAVGAAAPLQVSLANHGANAVAVKVDGSAVTQPVSGTVTATIAAGATTIAKAEDVASADADVGVPAMAVRKATPANTSGTDGDYEFLQMSAGRLWTSTVIDTALPAGSNAIGKLAANSGVTIGAVEIAAAQTLGTVTTVSTVTNISQFGGAAIAIGTGVRTAGTLRVTVATDDSVPVTGSVTVTQATGTNLHMVVDSGTVTTVSTVTSLTQMNGQAIAMGTGVRSAGTQRVTIATDDLVPVSGTVTASIAAGPTTIAKAEDAASADADVGVPAMAVRKVTPANTSGTDGDYEMLQMSAGRLWVSAVIDTALPAGSNAIGKLAANTGVTIGAVEIAAAQTLGTVTTVSTVTNLSQMGGAAIAMGTGIRSAGTQRVTIATDDVVPVTGTFWQSTQPVSIATAPVLVAGSAIIGKVGIDQTTPGTTNAVSLSHIGTTVVATGNGVVGAGVQRVAIASDNTAFAVNATLSAETTKVIGTINIAAAQSVTVSNSFALDATLTGGTQKSITRGGAKGATTAADVTSTSQSADRNALDVQIRTSAGVAVDTFGGGTQYADGTARGTATGTLLMVDDGTNIQSALGTTAGVLKVDLSATTANTTAIKVDGSAVTQPVSSTQLPAALGQTTKSGSLAVAIASDQDALGVYGKQTEVTGNITAQNANTFTGTPTASSFVQFSNTVEWASVLHLRISGTFSATVLLQFSMDNSTWFTAPTAYIGVNLNNEGGSGPMNAVGSFLSSAGLYKFDLSGIKYVRISCNSYTSGTMAIAMAASNTSQSRFQKQQDINITQLAGSSISQGKGVSGLGVIRTVAATEQTFRASTIIPLVAAVTVNVPFFNIIGSASKTVTIKRISVSGMTQTAVGYFPINVEKLSSASTSGTSTTLTGVPLDSSFAAATATVKAYTVAPTKGSLIGTLRSYRCLWQATTAVANGLPENYDFNFSDITGSGGIVLRGVAQEVALTFPVVLASAGTLAIDVEWTEE